MEEEVGVEAQVSGSAYVEGNGKRRERGILD